MEFSEKIMDETAEAVLSENAHAGLRAMISGLESSTPAASAGSGSMCFNSLPRSPSEAFAKVNEFNEYILHKSRLCYCYAVSEKVARKKLAQTEAENRRLKEVNDTLAKENARLKLQLRKLLGAGKRREDGGDAVRPDGTKLKMNRKRGAPCGHRGATRPIPEHVDETIHIPPPGICTCGSSRTRAIEESDSRYLEELEIRRKVVEKRYRRGICEECGRLVRHPDALNGPPVTVGNTVACMAAAMRQMMGCSYRKLSAFFSEFLDFPLKPSAVLGIVNRVSDASEPLSAGIAETFRTVEWLNIDETGWKMDGQKWHLWCFCRPDLAYYVASPTRSSDVPRNVLGEDFKGTGICDFYGGYNFLQNTQRCLVHLQRDIAEEREVSPDDAHLERLGEVIGKIVGEAKTINSQRPPPLILKEKKLALENLLEEACAISAEPKSRTATLVGRIEKNKSDMLRFADNPEIDFHNNRAERQLRPAVIFRKISFGNRTELGAYRNSVLASVVQTIRLKKLDLKSSLEKLMEAQPEEKHKIVRDIIDSS